MNWMRVGAAALATGACALLVACGSGVVSDLDFQKGTQLRSDPSSEQGRILVVGDDFSDFGQNGYVYSVNDGSRNWIQQLAHHYGVTIKTQADGGWGYAQGQARVDSPDTTSGTSAPSVKEQVTQLLADARPLRKNDVVFINGGMWDIVDSVEAHGSVDAPVVVNEVKAAAKALAGQVLRLLDAGAGHVAVTGVYDLGTSLWASPRSKPREGGKITDLSIAFNDQLQLVLVDEGDSVIYLDAAQFYRFVYDDDKRERFGVTNVNDKACGSTPVENCNPGNAAADYNKYLFADALHFTPYVWRLFGSDDAGENAYQRFSDRWGRP